MNRPQLKMNPYKCKNCKNKFDTQESLTEHIESVHNDKPDVFTCAVCSKKFKAKGKYMDHLKAHTNNDVRHECTLCPCFFKNPGHLKNHMDEVHGTKKKSYRCNQCSKKYETKAALNSHVRGHHNNELVLIKCSFCNRVYASKHSLKWHVHINHNKDFKRSQCPYCPSDFKWPHHLKVHIKKAHIEKGHAPSDLLKKGLSSIRRKTNNCVVCDEKFEKKLDLMLHLKKAHNQELDIYTCCVCPAVFSLRNSLIIHLDDHKRKRTIYNHKCDQCHPECNPKPFVIDDEAEDAMEDNRTEIEKEIIDFEITLMEDEDIRKLIKYRVRHERRKQIHAERKKQLLLSYRDSGTEDLGCANVVDLEEFGEVKDVLESEKGVESEVEEFNGFTEEDNVFITEKDVKTVFCEKCDNIDCACDQIVNKLDDIDGKDHSMDKEVKIFLQRINLDENTNSTKFKCEMCDCTFVSKSTLEEHLKLSHLNEMEDKNYTSKGSPVKNVRNPTKNYKTPTKMSEEKERRGEEVTKDETRKVVSRKKFHQCRMCLKKFTKPINLGRHIKLNHTKPKVTTKNLKYDCKICKETFNHAAKYANHVRFNHKEKSTAKRKTVENPPKNLKKKSNPTADSGANEKCGKCDVFFSTKLELLRHISDVHMAIKTTNFCMYWCHKCDLKFPSKLSIKEHFKNNCN